MYDVVIIPREKFSKLGICLSSLNKVKHDIKQIFLCDAGYPARILDAESEKIKSMGVILLPHVKFRLANACLNGLRKYGCAKWILLLENDCELMSEKIHEALMYAEERGFSVVQPRIFETDGKSIHYDPPLSYIEKTENSLVHRVVRNPRDGFPQVYGARRIFHIEKHALFIKREILASLGEFESFLVTRSHWDLSFRLHQQEHKIMMSPNIHVRFIFGSLEQDDVPYFRWRWDREKAIKSNDYLKKKWNIKNYHSSVLWLDEMLAGLNAL